MITDKMLKAAVAEYGEWSAREEETGAGGGCGYVTRAGKVVLQCADADTADEMVKREAMQAALETAEAGAWEPIETAPKSLLRGVLLWGGQLKSTADWTETMYPIAAPVIGWFDKMDRVWVIGNGESHDDRIIAVAPTHWRPLPTPPAR